MSRVQALEQALPSSIEAERLILGVILLDNTVLHQAAEILRLEEIFLVSNRRIYEKMLALYERGQAIDPLTLQEELRRAGELEAIGGPAYLATLFDGVPRFSNIEAYIKLVKGKALLRRLAKVGAQVAALAMDAEEEPEEILAKAEQLVLELADERVRQGFILAGDAAARQLNALEAQAGQEQIITGVATGFADLDYLTTGFQRGDLIILAARPGLGKTALALNLGVHCASDKQAVVGIFSLEMSTEQLANRLLCAQARVGGQHLRSGHISREEWRRLAVGVGELAEMKLFLDDTPALNLLEMRAKARRLKHERKRLDLLVVDYLQLMGSRGRFESRQQEVSTLSRGLKTLAKELDVPILALSQLSRAPETRSGSHRPQLSDLRESGAIEADADVVLFIYREEVYKPETQKQNIAEIIIGKQRNGPTGSAELVFLKQISRFEDKYQGATTGGVET